MGLSYGSAGKGNQAVIVGAYNSYNAKVRADVICSGPAGNGDDILINQLIESMPPNGGTLFFLGGTYALDNPVTIDRSWVTLEGECHPMWGGYLASWSGINTVGITADVGARLNQTGSGNGITIANSNIPDNSENRHRGICIKNLYITGTNSYTGTGIQASSAGHDFCRIEHCVIQKFQAGIIETFDSGILFNNSIQDINGCAINSQGPNTRICWNLVFDIAGANNLGAIYVGSTNAICANNKIGDIANDGIIVATYGSVISANQIGGVYGRAIVVQWSGNAVTGNVIDYKTTSYGKTHRTAGAIVLVSGTDGAVAYGANSVTGNTLLADSTTSESAGVYALDGASTAGNYVEGNCIRGLWNNSGTAVNASLTGGTNVVGNNPTS